MKNHFSEKKFMRRMALFYIFATILEDCLGVALVKVYEKNQLHTDTA